MACVSPVLLLALIAAPAAAAVGPPRPVATPTPAQQAIALYSTNFAAVPVPAPCRRAKNNEIVVCGAGGRGGSPDRLPLPDERDGPQPRYHEAPTGQLALAATGQPAGHAASLNVIAAAMTLFRLGYAIVDPEGQSDLSDKLAASHK